MSQHPDGAVGDASADKRTGLVRHEEELDLTMREYEAGTVRARKRVETERVERVEPRSVEYGDLERVAAHETDSGEVEILEDGSVSIPLLEERLVVTKELVVRERVIVRKRTVTEERRIEAELRKDVSRSRARESTWSPSTQRSERMSVEARL